MLPLPSFTNNPFSFANTPFIDQVNNPEMPDASELQKLRSTYPVELLKHLPVEKLYALPQYILHLGDEECNYNHFPFNNEMPNAVRGILAKTGRVFIAVRYVDESEETPTTKTDTLFQRYNESITDRQNWAIACGARSHIHLSGGMSSADFEYLARLITGQSCGPRYQGLSGSEIEGTRKFRGMSVVHLGQAQKLRIA